MRKSRELFYILVWLSFILPGISQDTEQDEKQETAWEVITPEKQKTGYYYGLIELPPNFVTQLLSNDEERDNPFEEDIIQSRKPMNDIAPYIPMEQLPLCLPAHPSYYDLSEIFHENGVIKSDKEWILMSGGIGGDGNLHYCFSVENSDILLNILTPLCCGIPQNINYHSTLLSVPDQGLFSEAWTIDRLTKLQPVIHARHSSFTRSGEKTSIRFFDPTTKFSSLSEIEPILGQSKNLIDLNFRLNHRWASNDCPQLNCLTNHTLKTGNPFVSDLGIHGENQRNFLLIQNTTTIPLSNHRSTSVRQYIDKIDGIYAMRVTNKEPKQSIKIPDYPLHSYRCNFDFISLLKTSLESIPADGADPFAKDETQALTSTPSPAPIRINKFPLNQYMLNHDVIYDVTPQFKLLGLHNRNKEKALYNKSQSIFIIQGSLAYRAGLLNILKKYRNSIHMIKVTARLVEVDSSTLQSPNWNMIEIKKRHPRTLRMYSATAKSGTKAISGGILMPTGSQPSDTEEFPDTIYEFKIEPTVYENNTHIDLRFEIHSKPLTSTLFSIHLKSGVSLEDGKPMIIELGHPNNSEKTIIMILQADLITPEGKIYRHHIKHLESLPRKK